ncbi:MORN repeat protein [Mucilaginibacter gracilis]|uniref:MORN repeat protein n=1 Tax=Mucilaginibacter gracilis TaxID=423350 RepID=A0A495J805_9SPHI|nr:hypothetical protein [Mucilaginibacter gracilis]RKR84568.1 MORN repeat protein [Mucilaginibacter gracilis]
MPRFVVLLIAGILLLAACKPPAGNKPPQLLVKNFDPNLLHTDSGWFYKGKAFNGYMIEVDRDNSILYKLPIIEGKEQGQAFGRFNTGEKLMLRNFKDGKKEGSFEQWWPNGNLHYLFNYKGDKMDGRQMVFYPNGKHRQESNFLDGKEEGIQRQWAANGSLLSNYTIKNGTLYGIIKVKSCLPTGH